MTDLYFLSSPKCIFFLCALFQIKYYVKRRDIFNGQKKTVRSHTHTRTHNKIQMRKSFYTNRNKILPWENEKCVFCQFDPVDAYL